ncbi:hypothetical protein K443DRAFT_107811, partial [Laccaria amethystina LaAM-08-1]
LLREYPGRQYHRLQGPGLPPIQRRHARLKNNPSQISPHLALVNLYQQVGEKMRISFWSALPKNLLSSVYRPPATVEERHDACEAAPFEADDGWRLRRG